MLGRHWAIVSRLYLEVGWSFLKIVINPGSIFWLNGREIITPLTSKQLWFNRCNHQDRVHGPIYAKMHTVIPKNSPLPYILLIFSYRMLSCFICFKSPSTISTISNFYFWFPYVKLLHLLQKGFYYKHNFLFMLVILLATILKPSII